MAPQGVTALGMVALTSLTLATHLARGDDDKAQTKEPGA
jgi:hypothetical protein